ncbi:DUF1987 domain-containing protein [Labrenzia sp. VG12]|uniref:DUF1987 domain-containing protein n=1 Tax=Labrenzia sp. VG12 TaxID=2021862 RepID=UPI000B8C5BDF|nr:DUF1987 domain-containing protein [Labrenzia sp. VG12]ASP36574.1 Fe-S oxidoreductase [Labrenzia sp. VG12]
MTPNPLYIDETPRSPRVELDPDTGHLALTGESYPEDASAFYGPILQNVASYLATTIDAPLTVDMRFIYFNSSSAKAIMNLFQMLEENAEGGRSVTVNWFYDPDDDLMAEMGEDFAEDFRHASFYLKPDTEVA